jgi:cell division protein FtsI/penicillin-binding protein 2
MSVDDRQGDQAILERNWTTPSRKLRPDNATGLVLDPTTGEILAMTSRPTFDLNQIVRGQARGEKNPRDFDMVEPGSTFKIVVASAADRARITPKTARLLCENGAFSFGGRILPTTTVTGR